MDEGTSGEDPTASILRELETLRAATLAGYAALIGLSDLLVMEETQRRVARHPNPLTRFGQQCFSQSDEDGITLEIIRRLGLTGGVFAEFGVGSGMENNTVILAAMGWGGLWIGAEPLSVKLPANDHFCFLNAWIDLSSLRGLVAEGMRRIGAERFDVMSLDLDGNDFHLVEDLLLAGHRPRLFIVEYNGKFPPPVRFQVPYHPKRRWNRDDNFGASLASFVDLFSRFDYRLICCNAQTGANAFFIRAEDAPLFPEVPEDIGRIYAPLRPFIVSGRDMPRSKEVVEQVLAGVGSARGADQRTP